MTKKDYQAIADCFTVWTPEVEAVAMKISVVLQKDNPRFDRARFLNACFEGVA
jgi:hypothetical protein